MGELINTTMKQGQDPDDYLMEETLACTELDTMGEPISYQRLRTSVYKGLLRSTIIGR